MTIKSLNEWGIKTEKPLIISGPCSAETEEQVLETAKGLQAEGVRIFRAGIWKPRTRPNAFEGVGSVGLDWLKTVKQETGLLVSTEVANVKHVYEVLKAGVDIIWIGARTTVNPFAVQEIADALKGVDIPVFVKNPVNPDLELWIGALERLNQAGISRLGAIHRGFSSYDKSMYRNTPQWQLPIELKRRFPELTMICDPSHICGNRENLVSVSQKAIDLNFDGLIIESHRNPDEAWSDAKQQITPKTLGELVKNLTIRNENPENGSLEDIADLRFQIDSFDDNLMEILYKRMEAATKIGVYKKEHNMTILQTGRWDEIVNSRIEKGDQLGLSPEIITAIFEAIHQESINKQTVILNK